MPCRFIQPQVSVPPNPVGVLLPGQVLAVGGLRDATGSLLMPGDSFAEPLSGKTVRLLGASQQAGQISAHAGGSQALLDANVLVAQRQVIMRLQQCREPAGSGDRGLLEAAVKDMRQALALSLHHILHQARRLERQLAAARDIEASGGRIGMCGCGPWHPDPRTAPCFSSSQHRTWRLSSSVLAYMWPKQRTSED